MLAKDLLILLQQRVDTLVEELGDLGRGASSEVLRVEDRDDLLLLEVKQRVGHDAVDQVVLAALLLDAAGRRLGVNAQLLVQHLAVAALFDRSSRMTR